MPSTLYFPGEWNENGQRATVLSCSNNQTLPINLFLVPKAGDLVIARVTRTGTRSASCEILAVVYDQEPQKLTNGFKGMIREQDVENKIENSLHLLYRPLDLVSCRIIGVGDGTSGYILQPEGSK